MRKTLRIGLVPLLAIVALAIPGPALAFTTTVTLLDAELTDKQTITLTGTIQCAPGASRHWAEITATADQNGRLGAGTTGEIDCPDAGLQTWTLEVTGLGFHGGWADFVVTGLACGLNPFEDLLCDTDTQEYPKFHLSH